MKTLHPNRSLLTTLSALPPSTRTTLLRSPLLKRSPPRPTSITHRRHNTTTTSSELPAPREGSGPLLTRTPNRALPNIHTTRNTWLITLPLFLTLITSTALAFFNYQKASSSTVASILYSLRTSPTARELLGDEIYFASKVPWVKGEMNQLHGVIDIRFWVKGTKGQGETRFVARRAGGKRGAFRTEEWSLVVGEGVEGERRVELLTGEGGVPEVVQVVE